MDVTNRLPTKIMVVEDEALVSMEIQQALRGLGYDISAVAFSGEEAVENMIDTRIDLVLMDIRLGGDIDGIEAARRIQERFDIPVLFLTAFSDDETLQRSKATDSYGYLLKPFGERSLYVAIETALSKAQTDRRVKEQREWLFTVLESLGEALIVADTAGIIRFENPAAEALTGWRTQEVVGKGLAEVLVLLGGKDRTKVTLPLPEPQSPAEAVHRENLILVAKDNSETSVDCHLGPLKSHRGNTMGLVVVLRRIGGQSAEQKKVDALIRRELEATAAIQKDRLPPRDAVMSGVRIDWLFLPSTFGAGDIFNVLQLDQEHLGFYLLDVAGCGFNAALFSMILYQLLSAREDEGGILIDRQSGSPPRILPPGEVLQKLNRRFYFKDNDNPFFTMVYGILATPSGIATLARAGHPYPIHQIKKGKSYFQSQSQGTAIGVFEELQVEEYGFELAPGDRLVLYSDGILECTDREKNHFTGERLLDTLKAHREDSLREVIQGLEGTLQDWRGREHFDDDLSLLILERE